jgi:two-component system NtrC family response regulator
MAVLLLKNKKYLLNKPLTTIGSDNTVDISLPGIAPLHAHILKQKGKYILSVLPGCSVYLGSKKITSCELKHGDEIVIGGEKIVFSLIEEGGALDLEKRNLEILVRIGRALTREYDTQKLLEIIIDLALEITGAERGFVVLLNQKGEFDIYVARHLSGETERKQISQTIMQKMMTAQQPVSFSLIKDEEFKFIKSIMAEKIETVLAVPLRQKGKGIIGGIYLDSREKMDIFSPQQIKLMESFADYAAVALERSFLIEKEKEAAKKLAYLKAEAKYARQIKQMEQEAAELKHQLEIQSPQILGNCPQMQEIFGLIEKIASMDISVLITGETGTGKELVARAIHQKSLRAKSPFVVINCGAIPENLLEAELFGFEKGAFTGATSQKRGKFELAHQGTIFLDEIAEMPLFLQTKLLRAIQEREIERIGGQKVIKLDLRFIAATNKNLSEEMKKGNFREDLFYRLKEIEIKVPPLRERGKDIFLLANYFLQKYSRMFKKQVKAFRPEVFSYFFRYRWPGNVRELESRVKRAVVMAPTPYLSLKDLDFAPEEKKKNFLTLREARATWESAYIKEVFEGTGSNISQTAQILGIDRKTLREILKRYETSNLSQLPSHQE